ncbi:hypothetical protein [Nesterenkonia sp. K-15-9-6]|uniref:hypothetical protein n=1 Tax=Nesterenkonia sp. K-15-9-6 TaxID=3093918 RepID=UPI0040449C46
MTDKLPQRVRQAFIQAGYINPRNGEPSVRSLTTELGLNNATVSRYFFQQSRMKIETRQAVAEALGFDVAEMDELMSGQGATPYQPPETAHKLSFRNRRLVDQLINALAEADDEEVVEDEHDSAPMTDELTRRRTRADHPGQHSAAAFQGDPGTTHDAPLDEHD